MLDQLINILSAILSDIKFYHYFSCFRLGKLEEFNYSYFHFYTQILMIMYLGQNILLIFLNFSEFYYLFYENSIFIDLI